MSPIPTKRKKTEAKSAVKHLFKGKGAKTKRNQGKSAKTKKAKGQQTKTKKGVNGEERKKKKKQKTESEQDFNTLRDRKSRAGGQNRPPGSEKGTTRIILRKVKVKVKRKRKKD